MRLGAGKQFLGGVRGITPLRKAVGAISARSIVAEF